MAVSKNPLSTWPSQSRNWALVILLTVIYILSFIDRYILGLLIEPIKADLGLTDTQIGLILGLSFAIFYALMGLPLGWLADRKRRTWIIAGGLALWSLATALSGLSRNFVQLFITRIGVGVGEATLSPCAMSLIADSFPPERWGKPIALYYMALSIGTGLAALAGAVVIGWAMTTEFINVPYIGVLKPWLLMPNGHLSIIILGITMMGSALTSATGVTALLNIIPANMRGQVVALYYMAISLFGIGFGPLSIGLMNDHIFGEAGLRYSMAVLPIIFGLPLLVFLPRIRRLYRKELNA